MVNTQDMRGFILLRALKLYIQRVFKLNRVPNNGIIGSIMMQYVRVTSETFLVEVGGLLVSVIY